MKRIRLLTLPDPRIEYGDPQYEAALVDYRTLVEAVIRTPLDRQTGVTIPEMRQGIRVLDALDTTECKVSNVLTLEDADWQHLKEKTDKMPWAQVDRRILQFYEDVTEATDAVRDEARSNSHAV